MFSLLRFRGLWRHGDFLKLWTGETVSAFGSLVGGTALQFTAILVLGATPFQIALLAVSARLPGFLASLAAGVWIDRLSRRPIMILADCGRALLLATIPAAALLGVLRIEHLYTVAFLTGLLTTFFDVAYQSYLPSLLSRDDLLEGNSKLAATASIAEVSGFGVAGWLVQIFTAPIAILVDAASFLVSAVAIGLIRTPERPRLGQAETSVWREAYKGVQVVLSHPLLRAIAVSTIIFEISFQVVGAVISLFGLRVLGLGPGVLGMIYGVGGISSLVGALVAGRFTRWLGIGPAMIFGMMFMGLSILLLPLAHGANVAAGAFLVAQQLFGDGAYTIYDINQLSLRQVVAPEEVLGRVNATIRVGGFGAMLLGSIVGGLVGDALGPREALVVGGIGTLVGALSLALSPVRSTREAPSAG